MDRFSKLHPLTHLLFFAFTFIFVLSINNPFFSIISLICATLYYAKSRGKEIFSTIKFAVIIIAVVSLFNMLFSHWGNTTLFSIKSTDFTLESLFYGFNQGVILSSVIVWFSIFSRVSDSERVIYIFRFAPKCALIFSMVLGFIPRFTKKLDDIKAAKIALYGGEKPKGLKNRFKDAMLNFSALVTYSLESSIITADSMEARAYNPKAVRASRYKFVLGDIILIASIVLLSAYIIVQKLNGNIAFEFEPKIRCISINAMSLICFAVLELLPLIVSLMEELLWKRSRAKI
jgi:energy-coupling factor transport system permease protein